MSEAFGTNNSYLYEEQNQTGSPERLLMLAMLERAILDYVGNDRREAESAESWIFADDDEATSAPFSFAYICRELDMEPLAVAKMIYEMPKRGNRRIAPWYFQRWQRTDNSAINQAEELQN